MTFLKIQPLFKPSDLMGKQHWYFFVPRVVLFLGIIAWVYATSAQMHFMPEQRFDLLGGAVPLLFWYLAYTLGCAALVWRYPARRKSAFQAIIILDVAFVTMLIMRTGLCQSNFYLVYYLLIGMEVFYFGIVGGAILTLTSCIVYFFIYLVNSEQLFAGDFGLRVGLMFLTFVVLSALEENEKHARRNIEALNNKLEENNQRLIEENEYKEIAAREKSILLNNQQEAAQRRRMHIDFAKELNAKQTLEKAASVFSRYVASLIEADHICVITINRKERAAEIFMDSEEGPYREDIPFNHPMIEDFCRRSGEADTFGKTWVAGGEEALPDCFMIVPDQEPEVIHVEGVTGGVMGAATMVVMTRSRRELFDPYMMEEARLIISHLAVAMKNLALRDMLQEMADTDGLTGLYNHRYFKSTLAREIRRSVRYDRPLSLILFDIDHFKKFNDNYGHPVGDAVLKELAVVVQDALRNVDLLARYGGEEFVIILPETDTPGAMGVAERIRHQVADHRFKYENIEQLFVTVSLGIATLPPANDVEEIIEMADQALYRAKENGRNQVAS